jgi:hypothetical protein
MGYAYRRTKNSLNWRQVEHPRGEHGWFITTTFVHLTKSERLDRLAARMRERYGHVVGTGKNHGLGQRSRKATAVSEEKTGC